MQIDPNKWSDQDEPAAGEESRFKTSEEVEMQQIYDLCVLERVLLPSLIFQELLVLRQFNHWRDADVDHESLDSC